MQLISFSWIFFLEKNIKITKSLCQGFQEILLYEGIDGLSRRGHGRLLAAVGLAIVDVGLPERGGPALAAQALGLLSGDVAADGGEEGSQVIQRGDAAHRQLWLAVN